MLIAHRHLGARKISDAIYQEVFAFGNQTNGQDDVTVVVVKKMGSKICAALETQPHGAHRVVRRLGAIQLAVAVVEIHIPR